MCRYAIIAALAVFVLVSSVCHAEESPDIRIHLTYGPGGPERKTNAFAGERILIRVELPESFSFNEKIDLLCEASFVSQTNKARLIRNPVPIPLQSFTIGNGPSFFIFNVTIPPDFEEGKYDLTLFVQDRNGTVLGEGKRTIDLYSSSNFGTRNLSFRKGIPGTGYWLPSSNVFTAGETSQINLGVGGLSLNANEEIDAVIKLVLVDPEGVSVEMMEPMFLRSKPEVFQSAELGIPWYTHEFHLAQPGNFVLKLEVEDLTSQEKDSLELPLYVVDPNQYQ